MLAFVGEILIKTVLYLTLLLISFVVTLKLWLEPVKGMCKCNVKLNGKVALVTGGNSGIGLETARALARKGAKVIIACRNEDKSRKAVADIIKSTGNNNVEFKRLDLSKFESIRKFADDFNKTQERLDILVNNAGAVGKKETLTKDGIDLVTQVNYIGPFLLTNLLLDKLINSKPSRIVIVSSYANQFHYFNPDDVAGKKPIPFLRVWFRYANTKLCNILWTKALAKRLPKGVTVNALHPGIVKTDLFDNLPKLTKGIVLFIIQMIFKTAEEGAQTSIHLCVSPELEKVTGEFFANCKIGSASKLTKDDILVEKVWENTMILLKEIK